MWGHHTRFKSEISTAYPEFPDRVIISYHVDFDEPQDDGSGDGSYRGAEIGEESLKLIQA
jgi:hypothetical protein